VTVLDGVVVLRDKEAGFWVQLGLGGGLDVRCMVWRMSGLGLRFGGWSAGFGVWSVCEVWSV
jgi:hypothetical protein